MPEIDARRLGFKIVYYGPEQGGKTSNLLRLRELLPPGMAGEMMALDTRGGSTLLFDLLPFGFRSESGLLVKFRLFSVPGKTAYDATRKAVLARADGVVFVADADRSLEAINRESFRRLADDCAEVGLAFKYLPLVVQFNKCDLPNAVPEAETRERWSAAPWPLVFAAASGGRGVTQTLEALLRSLHRRFDGECALRARHALDEDTFVARAMGRT